MPKCIHAAKRREQQTERERIQQKFCERIRQLHERMASKPPLDVAAVRDWSFLDKQRGKP